MTHDYANVKLVEAVLDAIRKEMDRLYYNKYQKEMNSPFDNTGETYKNSTFTVRAYYWGDDDDLTMLPNFEYKGLRVYWYKYSGRGTEVLVDKPLTTKFLSRMLDDCIASMKNDFGG